MHRNPWFTLVVGLMIGLVFGYVLAERQRIPPGKALRLGLGPQAEQGGGQGQQLPEGHPPVDGMGQGGPAHERRVAEIRARLDANPEDARLMAALGNEYYDAGGWENARTWYERSLAASPNDVNVMTDLAIVFRKLGQPERAIGLLDEVLKLRPDHWQALFNKVVILNFDLHDHDGAAELFRTLKRMSTDDPSIPDLTGLEKEILGG